MEKRLKRSAALLLVIFLFCSVSFTGCRRSEVLEQKIYTENQQVDKDNQTKEKDNDEENDNEDQEITSKKETNDAQKERNQKDTKSVKGNGSSGSTAKLKYGETANANGEAEGSGNGTATGNDTQGVGVTDTTGTTPSSGGDKQTVDPDQGETITIPDSYSKYAAVGQVAVFVEMMGGSGKLKASSESFVSSSLAQSAFSDIGEVQALWSGDGSTGFTGDLSQLITLLTADSTGKGACLYDDSSLTGDQVQALNAAGIDTFPISLAQTTSQAYKDQVTAIGQMLGDDAISKAAQYCSWYDDVLHKAESAKLETTKYTLYISAWDDNASWQVSTESSTGLAIAPSKTNVRLFDEYLSTAGVTNRITGISGELGTPRYWYVNPLLGNGNYAVTLNGVTAETLKDDENNKMTSVPSTDDAAAFYLGESTFPAVITASQEVKQKLENVKSQTGLYHYFPNQTFGNGASGYGWEINGQPIYSTVHGDYAVYALPQGLCGSWASGTPEGVLTSMWVCSQFGGGIDMSEVKSELDEFYSTFCAGASVDTGSLLNN